MVIAETMLLRNRTAKICRYVVTYKYYNIRDRLACFVDVNVIIVSLTLPEPYTINTDCTVQTERWPMMSKVSAIVLAATYRQKTCTL